MFDQALAINTVNPGLKEQTVIVMDYSLNQPHAMNDPLCGLCPDLEKRQHFVAEFAVADHTAASLEVAPWLD